MWRLTASLFAVALVAGVFATDARADSFTIYLDGGIVGQPSSPTPTGTPSITFTDTGTNEVTVTMSLAGLSGNEKVDSWFFNCSIDPSNFTFTHVSGDDADDQGQTPGIQVVYNSTSDWKADGTGGYHDIKFNFSSADAAAFKAGETSVYRITGTGLTAAHFNTYGITSSNGGEVYRTVAHVLGIGAGAVSLWVGDVGTPVPEPSAVLLTALGLAGLATSRRRASSRTRS